LLCGLLQCIAEDAQPALKRLRLSSSEPEAEQQQVRIWGVWPFVPRHAL
jgi:hypothetical protein